MSREAFENSYAKIMSLSNTSEIINARVGDAYHPRYVKLNTAWEFWQAALQSGDTARETLAAWMLARGFSTGHGDTLDDLLTELGGQIQKHSGEPGACVGSLNEFDAMRLVRDGYALTDPLYTTPQPVVPELTGKQWSAMRTAIADCAYKMNRADHTELRSAHLDAAPEAVYQALRSAGKEKAE